jgi:DNA-binding NarL/FixJ family response regulator
MAPTTEPTTARILVAIKNPLVREELVSVLDDYDDLQVIASVDTSDAFVDTAASLRPDVALIDDQLLDSLGPDICARICDSSDGTRCIIYTAVPLPGHLTEAATAVVFKDLHCEQLIRTIRTIVRKQRQPDAAALG